MDFPSIRSWIEELVNDLLENSLVDPGHVTIPLCDDPGLLGRKSGYAAGVLTLTIQGGEHGKATNDTQWCSVTLDKQKIRTKEITSSDKKWEETISVLVRSLQFDKLRIKIKGKRKFGPNYTVVQYILPLLRLNLEQNPVQDMTLEEDNIVGSDLKIKLDYYDLPVLELANETDEKTFQKNYLGKEGEEESKEVAGVLFVRVHKGVDLIPMDSSGKSDPYVIIFANSERIHLGHVMKETLNPEWDTMVEFFTTDYTKTTLSFIVHDSDSSALSHVLSAGEEDDFMGSCNMALTKEWCVFKKTLDLHYKIPGNLKKGINETMNKVGKLIVSVIFRPVSVIKSTIKGTKNSSLSEGEPLNQKHTKIDAATVEAMLRTERGTLTISILRARNLIALDINGRSDPFVSIRVGNSKQEKFKSRVMPKTLNPVWNEDVTIAMPQKHEKVSIEVYDKDPFTQEKMGVLRFDYNKLLELGDENVGTQWFTLNDAKSGEIQLEFKTVTAGSAKSGGTVDAVKEAVSSYSLKDGSEHSEDDEFLVFGDGV